MDCFSATFVQVARPAWKVARWTREVAAGGHKQSGGVQATPATTTRPQRGVGRDRETGSRSQPAETWPGEPHLRYSIRIVWFTDCFVCE